MLDRNNVTGSLSGVCFREIPLAIVDCDEVDCPCCDTCCNDNHNTTDCHDFNLLANADPAWESGYKRQFFDFGNNTLWGPADDDEFGGTR